jgi:hypothetical protein
MSMARLIDPRHGAAPLLISVVCLFAACAQEQPVNNSIGPGGSTGGNTVGSGSGGSQSTGFGGTAAPGGSNGAAGVFGSGGFLGGGGVVASGTGGSQSGGSSGSGGSSQMGGRPGSGGGSVVSGGRSGSGGLPGGAGGGSALGGADGSFAAMGCAGKTYKFCDDFEMGTVGALGPGWTKFAGYGAAGATDVALASDAAHSGTMSLKSDSINRGQQRAQHSLMALGGTAYNHWGRIFYKVQQPSPPPQKTATNTVIHITWTSLVGPKGENRVVDIVEAMDGTHQWLFNIPSDGCCTSSAYSWKFDANWHCAEWWVDVATNSYRFFSDSAEVTKLAFSGRTDSTMSDYTAIVLGATWYQQNGTILSPFVIWFDDLAIDDNRIGCQ